MSILASDPVTTLLTGEEGDPKTTALTGEESGTPLAYGAAPDDPFGHF